MTAKIKQMNKLPAITLSFWIMKICATTLGETAGDLLSMTMKVGYAVSSAILLSFFFATLAGQLSTKKFHYHLLGGYPIHKYGGNNHFGLYGSDTGTGICNRFADTGVTP